MPKKHWVVFHLLVILTMQSSMQKSVKDQEKPRHMKPIGPGFKNTCRPAAEQHQRLCSFPHKLHTNQTRDPVDPVHTHKTHSLNNSPPVRCQDR